MERDFMRIAVGADHAGRRFKEALFPYIKALEKS